MDDARRRHLKRQCDPTESLEPDDLRVVDLDAPEGEGRRARGWDWVERLVGTIRDAPAATCTFITGLPGNGKSTDLKKVAEKLRSGPDLHFFPVIIDADRVVDLANPIDITYVLFSIIYQAERQVLTLEKGSVKAAEEAMKEGFFKRIWGFLTKTDATLKEAKFKLGNVAELVFEMRSRAGLRDRVRDVVASHLTTILAMVREELKLINGRYKELSIAEGSEVRYDGIVIIYDSLEKLSGTALNWRDVRDSAVQLFSSNRFHLRLPVHTIYTVPPSVTLLRSEDISFLPMIRISDRDTGEPFVHGVEIMRSIIRKRIPDPDLEAIFGPEAEDRTTTLINQSGGDPRYIIRLLNKMLSHRPLPLDGSSFSRFLNEQAEDIRRTVYEDDFEWLRQVADQRLLIPRAEDQCQAVDRLFGNGVVFRYLNDREWYDLSPSVRSMPGLGLQPAGDGETLHGT